MIKKILICLLMLCSGKAYANISVFPYSVDFQAESNKRVQNVRVINTSSETQTYRVSFVNFKQDENGDLTEVKDKDGMYANKFLSWSPRQFTLKPNEVQTVNIARKSMAQAPDGEFVSHIKISEVAMGSPKVKNENAGSDTISMQLKALFAITLPVTITKGKNLKNVTKVEKYKVLPDNVLSVTLSRSGNMSSRINVAVINDKGEEIGRVNNVKIYLPTDRLNLRLTLNKNLLSHNAQLKLEDAWTKKDISTQAISL